MRSTVQDRIPRPARVRVDPRYYPLDIAVSS
jgi:hypothetical protein